MARLTLTTNDKEFTSVLRGETNIITREIRPKNATKFVKLNEGLECTEIIPFNSLRLVCKNGKALTAKVVKQMLMEIEDEDGKLVFYEENGIRYQMVEIDFTIADVKEE